MLLPVRWCVRMVEWNSTAIQTEQPQSTGARMGGKREYQKGGLLAPNTKFKRNGLALFKFPRSRRPAGTTSMLEHFQTSLKVHLFQEQHRRHDIGIVFIDLHRQSMLPSVGGKSSGSSRMHPTGECRNSLGATICRDAHRLILLDLQHRSGLRSSSTNSNRATSSAVDLGEMERCLWKSLNLLHLLTHA